MRFAGKVHNGLQYTPCGKYILYPLGSFVVLKNLTTDKEAFFDGHSSEVSCLSVSSDGSKLVSGQVNLMSVKVTPLVYLVLASTAKTYPFAFDRLISLFGIWPKESGFSTMEQ
jgi:WD40 repeat protein